MTNLKYSSDIESMMIAHLLRQSDLPIAEMAARRIEEQEEHIKKLLNRQEKKNKPPPPPTVNANASSPPPTNQQDPGTAIFAAAQANPLGRKSQDLDWEDAASMASNMLERLEDLASFKPAAQQYVQNLYPKVESIMEWIAENQHVTPKQLTALENMEAGLQKWE